MINVIKTGDWAKALKLLDSSTQLKKAIHWAVEQEAQEARRRIIKGITEQAPGGQPFTPLSAITLILRRMKNFRGTKALIVTAALRNSTAVRTVGTGVVFVGVLRSAQRPDGKGLYDIARVHELGATITVRVTRKMHNWLMMQLRRAGYKQFARSKHPKFDRDSIFGYKRKYAGNSLRTIVIRIPPRPFIRPVIEEMARDEAGMRQRLTKRISQRMKLTL